MKQKLFNLVCYLLGYKVADYRPAYIEQLHSQVNTETISAIKSLESLISKVERLRNLVDDPLFSEKLDNIITELSKVKKKK